MIGRRTVAGFRALTVARGGPEGLEATFVPDAGMVGCSLRHRGEELLGQRGGLRSYVEKLSTMGIPFLHPWANRLAHARFSVAGREVVIPSGPPVHLDSGGLPIHGLLAAARGWRVERHEASADGGTLAASFDFAADDQLLEIFPFPHEARIEVGLSGARLTIATTIRASGDVAVPVSFGYHPYLRIPGVPRSDWLVRIPVSERLPLDSRGLPTGGREAVEVAAGPLGSRTFDDAYVAPPPEAPFVLAGGGRQLQLRLESGYRFAQVYAPAGDDLLAYEPMTAPTNALVAGGPELPLVQPGEQYEASFSITVAEEPGS